jgi:hypothetical protein
MTEREQLAKEIDRDNCGKKCCGYGTINCSDCFVGLRYEIIQREAKARKDVVEDKLLPDLDILKCIVSNFEYFYDDYGDRYCRRFSSIKRLIKIPVYEFIANGKEREYILSIKVSKIGDTYEKKQPIKELTFKRSVLKKEIETYYIYSALNTSSGRYSCFRPCDAYYFIFKDNTAAQVAQKEEGK